MRMEMMWFDYLSKPTLIRIKNNYFKNLLILLIGFAAPFCATAQEGTRNTKANIPSGKVMLIPFEPKMYWSDMDKQFNKQTNWSFNQIREFFRHQLDIQLQEKFKTFGSVVSFYSDSTRMKKDLQLIYTSTSVAFDPISQPRTSASQEVKNSGIKDGQLAVEINSENRFTNLVVNSDKLLNYLHTKYKASYFIFINQLDIKTAPDSYDVKTDSYSKRVDVHYTILDYTGALISAGIAPSAFSSKENLPKKIAPQLFAPVAAFIYSMFIIKVQPAVPSKQ